MKEIMAGIKSICPQTDYLMRFWQIKNANNPTEAEKEAYNDSKDSYDRDDNYNARGMFAMFYLKIRQPFLSFPGISIDKIDIIAHERASLFNTPMSPAYTYDLMTPLIVINLKSRAPT